MSCSTGPPGSDAPHGKTEDLGRSRYQAQAHRYIDSSDHPCAFWGAHLTLLAQQVKLPEGQKAEDFDPVSWFRENGWAVGVPYAGWDSDGQGGKYTAQVQQIT